MLFHIESFKANLFFCWMVHLSRVILAIMELTLFIRKKTGLWIEKTYITIISNKSNTNNKILVLLKNEIANSLFDPPTYQYAYYGKKTLSFPPNIPDYIGFHSIKGVEILSLLIISKIKEVWIKSEAGWQATHAF